MRLYGVLARSGVLLVLGVGVLGLSASASAETINFTEAGCSNWEVPSGVSQLTVAATGGAGEKGGSYPGAIGGAGGNGDEVGATVEVSPHEVFDVCVSYGGGSGGSGGVGGGNFGGKGGGASGLARSADFSAPVLVAGGGGGGGGGSYDDGLFPGVNGGSAGMPGSGETGGVVEGGSPSNSGGPGAGTNGGNGEFVVRHLNSGGGGGGGGGYVGGGGGSVGGGELPGSGGGAGGTDFCGGIGVTCGATDAGAGTGTGGVTITYTVAAPPSCTNASGKGTFLATGTPGHLTLHDELNTNTAGAQLLRVRYNHAGKVVYDTLSKLNTASCSGAPGERVFEGSGPASKVKSAGYTLSFVIREEGGHFYFKGELTKGPLLIEEMGGPLNTTTQKIS